MIIKLVLSYGMEYDMNDMLLWSLIIMLCSEYQILHTLQPVNLKILLHGLVQTIKQSFFTFSY